MVSFQRLLDNMKLVREQSEADDDADAMEAIRIGLNQSEDFWAQFLLVLGDSEALSMLLEVPRTKISGWHARVRKYLDMVRSADDQPDPKKRATLIHTDHDPFGGQFKADLEEDE